MWRVSVLSSLWKWISRIFDALLCRYPNDFYSVTVTLLTFAKEGPRPFYVI